MRPLIQEGEFKGSYEPSKDCRHQNSKPTEDTCAEGCCDYYRCDDCGRRFLVECPD